MKMALASVIKASASAAPERNKIRKTSAVLRKLSLNAAKNWHQNSGAKRLDSISGGGMPQYCRVPPPIIGDHTRKLAAVLAAKAGRYRWQRLQITHGFAPIGAGVLAGFHNHRAHTEAEGNTENNGKHRDPHGVPPRLRAHYPA